MNEKILLIIALACIAAGLPCMYVASKLTSPDDPRVLTELKGTILSVSEKEKITIINVLPETSIPVVYFDKVDFSKGDKIEVKGQLKSYNSKLEFVAEE